MKSTSPLAARHLEPELLDELPVDDPRAQRSRRDLQRIHRAMGTLRTLRRSLREPVLNPPPRSILELGGGDGSLLLRLARSLTSVWPGVQLTLLDRQDTVSDRTRAAYAALGWNVAMRSVDVRQWSPQPDHYDVCVTTLFLHHFDDSQLRALLSQVAAATDRFVACEPRRSLPALIGSRLVGCLGANAVTRGDAVKSVAAGFRADELTQLWPRDRGRWTLREYAAPPFSHVFTATRLPGN